MAKISERELRSRIFCFKTASRVSTLLTYVIVLIPWIWIMLHLIKHVFGLQLDPNGDILKFMFTVQFATVLCVFLLKPVEWKYHMPKKFSWYRDAEEGYEKESKSSDFVIFLRNVEFDNIVTRKIPSRFGWMPIKEARPIENAIAESAAVYEHRTLALWTPSDKNTNPNVYYVCVLDGCWREFVNRLISDARAIVVMFSKKSPGVLFESGAIAKDSDFSRKTIIVSGSKKYIHTWRNILPESHTALLFSSRLLESEFEGLPSLGSYREREEELKFLSTRIISSLNTILANQRNANKTEQSNA